MLSMKKVFVCSSILSLTACWGGSSLEIVPLADVSKTLSGDGEQTTYAVYQDYLGDTLVGGFYTNNSNNDNSVKDYNGSALSGLTGTSSRDGFVAHLGKSGTQSWIKRIGGTGADMVNAIAFDGINTYVAGRYSDNTSRANSSVDFNGNPLTGVTGTASVDIFVAKLDSSGRQLWIKTMGGTQANDIPTTLIVSPSGYIYVGGYYQNTSTNTNQAVDFSGATLNGKSTTSSQDAFIAKLSATDGTQAWIKTLGGSGSDRVYKLAEDNSGAIYVPGQYVNDTSNVRGAVDFAGGVLNGASSANSGDGYLAKLNSDGVQQWMLTYGGTSQNDFGDAAMLDSSGNVFFIGSFGNDTANSAAARDFWGNTLMGLSSTNSREIQIAKLTPSGSFIWVKTMGGTGSDRAQALGRDASDNIYVSGYVSNNAANANMVVDFSGASYPGKSTGAAGVDGFLVKLSNSGTQLWARNLGGNSDDVIENMSVNSNGVVAVVGYQTNNAANDNAVTDFAGKSLAGGPSAVGVTSFLVRWNGL